MCGGSACGARRGLNLSNGFDERRPLVSRTVADFATQLLRAVSILPDTRSVATSGQMSVHGFNFVNYFQLIAARSAERACNPRGCAL